MDYHRAVKILFDYFISKIYRTPNTLQLTPVNKKAIDNFVKRLSKTYPIDSIGFNYLLLYFSWNFNYWNERKTKRNPVIGWIVGPASFKRFVNRNTDGDFYIGHHLLREFSISLDDLHARLIDNDVELSDSIHPIEEKEKIRVDESARLYNCLMHTTLYNRRSTICMVCRHRKPCNSLMYSKFPQLHKARKNESVKA